MSSDPKPGPRNLITDVEGLTVGNAHDAEVGTGVTVVLPEQRAVAACDVRGGGPGTRETDALENATLVDEVDAIVLAGGSSYGLAAASAVTDWLGACQRGFRLLARPDSRATHAPPVSPIVPAAILYDLANGGNKNWGETSPYPTLGRAAVEAACEQFSLGNSGAGYGAGAGLYKGGLGSASLVTAKGVQVGAIMAVNAFGSVTLPGTECFWAWPFERDREFGGVRPPDTPLPSLEFTRGSKLDTAEPGANTTIGVVATNVALTPVQAQRVAIMAQDGIARAIRPVHTTVDGDMIFVLATATRPLDTPDYLAVTEIGSLAADTVARAIARAVYEAESLLGMTGYRQSRS